jgi:hypothetical protein
MMSIRKRNVFFEPIGASRGRSGPRPCPLGSAVREVCMQDPHRLEHWPDVCNKCNDAIGRDRRIH